MRLPFNALIPILFAVVGALSSCSDSTTGDDAGATPKFTGSAADSGSGGDASGLGDVAVSDTAVSDAADGGGDVGTVEDTSTTPGDTGAPPEDVNGFVYECDPGTVEACLTACGSASQRKCLKEWGPCIPPAEFCGNCADDDCDGLVDEDCFPDPGCNPEPTCPVAVIAVTSNGDVFPGDLLQLSGTQSHSADGAIVTWKWGVQTPDGSASAFSPSDGDPSPKYTVDTPGDYLFTLDVWDDQGTKSCVTAQSAIHVSVYPPAAPEAGCADGEREGFLDQAVYTHIAGCAGGWSVPGITPDDVVAKCNHAGGDDGTNAEGNGCAAPDLCAVGWHICKGWQEVAANSPSGCAGATPPDAKNKSLFFAMRQPSENGSVCGDWGDGFNDVFGCGNLGSGLGPDKSCGPLDRVLASTQPDKCGFNEAEPPLGPWECKGGGGERSPGREDGHQEGVSRRVLLVRRVWGGEPGQGWGALLQGLSRAGSRPEERVARSCAAGPCPCRLCSPCSYRMAPPSVPPFPGDPPISARPDEAPMIARTTLLLLLLLAAAPSEAGPPKTPLTPARATAPKDKEQALAAVKTAEDAVKPLAPTDPRRAEALHAYVDALLTAVAGLEGSNAALVAELRAAAVEAATEVRTKFPAYSRRSEVLLLEGEALLGTGDRSTAMARWQEVTQDERSPAALDAFVRLGDLYFDSAQLKQAIEAYDGALGRSQEGRLARYALYRRAWSRFNLEDYAPAMADLQALIEAARAPGAGAYLARLGAEAEKDWAFMYSVTGDPRSAESAVKALFPATYDAQLTRLADAYEQTARYAHAVRLYSTLVDKATLGAVDRLDLRVKLASVALALGEKRSALGKLQDLAKAAADLRRAGVDAATRKPSEDKAEALLRKTTLTWLDEAAKTRAADLRQAAFDLADAYLAAFPSCLLTPEVHLAYGTALLDAGKVDQALRELAIAAETHPETNAREAARMLMSRARARTQ